MKLTLLYTERPFNKYIYLFLAVIMGVAIGLLTGAVNQPMFMLFALAGLFVVFGTIVSVEFGLLFLVFLTYTRVSDIAVHYHNAPSIAKSFVVLLIVAIIIRWAIFNERPEGWQTPIILLGTYGLVGFTSLLYAPYLDRVWASLLDFIKDAAIAVGATLLLKRISTFRHVLWALLAAGIFMGSISVYQYVTKTFENNYGGFAQAAVMQIVGETDDYRISGPIGDPNFFAQIMIVLVPIALERMLHETAPYLKILAGYAVVVCILSIVFTFSRGAFLALALTLFILFLSFPPKPNQMPLFFISVLVVIAMIPIDYYNRILSLRELVSAPSLGFRTNDLAIRGRASENLTSLEMIKDHPFFGVGLNNYSYLYIQYSKSIGLAPSSANRSAHNLYLEVAAETGVIGLTTFLFIIFVAFRSLKYAYASLMNSNLGHYAQMITGYSVGLMGYIFAAVFVHGAYPRYFYLLIGLAFSLPLVARNEILNMKQKEIFRATNASH